MRDQIEIKHLSFISKSSMRKALMGVGNHKKGFE